ncbi:MAG: type II toxin-antitoxin system prevent-host-death family antitoxin [Candidimonas sp.]|nr:MAG: type II toxin-antitoxin system prevent-host-death family antitoxin [Candidimonas sp.]
MCITITTLSSRELNQDIGRAKKAALEGPVFITDRGKPVYVLLSIGEYQRITGKRRDPIHGARLRAWFDTHVTPEFAERSLPVDTTVALRCARLHVSDPRTGRDALMAATALVHGMTIVTRNTADFESTGARLLNPWIPASSN